MTPHRVPQLHFFMQALTAQAPMERQANPRQFLTAALSGWSARQSHPHVRLTHRAQQHWKSFRLISYGPDSISDAAHPGAWIPDMRPDGLNNGRDVVNWVSSHTQTEKHNEAAQVIEIPRPEAAGESIRSSSAAPSLPPTC
jgi:hypothetical protein